MSLFDELITRGVEFRQFRQHRINVLLNYLKLHTMQQTFMEKWKILLTHRLFTLT